MNLKQYFEKRIYYFHFFYSYLTWRIYAGILLSLLTGLLDGLGLALFIPLLEIVLKGGNSKVESGVETDAISSFMLENFDIELTLVNIFIIIFTLFLFKGLIKFIDGFLKVLWHQKMMREISFRNLDLLSKYKYPAFVNTDTGRIQNTLAGEVGKIHLAYKYYFKTIQFSVLVLVYFSFSIGVNWKFSFLVIIGGLCISILYKSLYKRTKYFSTKLVKETHRYNKLLLENINLFKYLKATGLIHNYANKIKLSVLNMHNTQRRLGIVDAALIGIREPLVIFVIFGSIFLYSRLFEDLVGGVLLSLLLIYRAFNYLMSSQEQWNLFLGSSGSLNNLKEFNKELEQHGESQTGGQIIKKFKREIQLKDISFRYNTENEQILKNISIKIEKNESLAIVGASGSGKSTLMNIIAGILVPDKGEILVDGVPMNKLDVQSFRRRIGYIVQDATIFNDTLFNNISFWQPKTKKNLMKFNEAVKKAKIDSFINSLPHREDNLLGVNGVNISGGQKQRISIARELYKDIDFLLLDEATSSLDTETEMEIQKNIDELKGQYTFIIIAHRLTTVKNADKIILLDNGEIQAIGTYNELLKSSLSFQKMVRLQKV